MEPPTPPPRYAVQRPKGRLWQTLHVDEDQDAATRVFQQLSAPKPRHYLRLIVLECEAGGDPERDFRWRLLQIYDPFKSGARTRPEDAGGGHPSGKAAQSARHRRVHERVRPPWHMYIVALILGLLAGAMVFLLATRGV